MYFCHRLFSYAASRLRLEAAPRLSRAIGQNLSASYYNFSDFCSSCQSLFLFCYARRQICGLCKLWWRWSLTYARVPRRSDILWTLRCFTASPRKWYNLFASLFQRLCCVKPLPLVKAAFKTGLAFVVVMVYVFKLVVTKRICRSWV